jgi:hypothetical protein
MSYANSKIIEDWNTNFIEYIKMTANKAKNIPTKLSNRDELNDRLKKLNRLSEYI